MGMWWWGGKWALLNLLFLYPVRRVKWHHCQRLNYREEGKGYAKAGWVKGHDFFPWTTMGWPKDLSVQEEGGG